MAILEKSVTMAESSENFNKIVDVSSSSGVPAVEKPKRTIAL